MHENDIFMYEIDIAMHPCMEKRFAPKMFMDENYMHNIFNWGGGGGGRREFFFNCMEISFSCIEISFSCTKNKNVHATIFSRIKTFRKCSVSEHGLVSGQDSLTLITSVHRSVILVS